MPSVHLLNVAPGDSTIIRHGSGRVSMIDVCDGNIEEEVRKVLAEISRAKPRGNFGMCQYPTNPIWYAHSIGIDEIWRFILSHPDMDHMDGLAALDDAFAIHNFWDTGARRPKPEFAEQGPYREEDWDRYVAMRDGKTGTNSRVRQAGNRFPYANELPEGGSNGPDGLYILAPDAELIRDARADEDINDGSYVLLYNSAGGRIILPGDAHDATWEYVFSHHGGSVTPCSFLLAPHHGRDSERSYDFLDVLKPELTLIGCTSSEYIDYGQWTRRNLDYITSNQAGNVVLEIGPPGIDVYIENDRYAEACNGPITYRNGQGYAFWRFIKSPAT
jgi:beta-lactamase superfamily II metal-dependent hydrolase